MPSLRARLTNAFLRVTTKSLWKPGLDIVDVRRHATKMDARLARRPLPVSTERIEIEGVAATWHGEPRLSERGTILYLHGGAWCIHLPGIYGRFATRLSALTGMRVLLPDYRLAPEHPFPAATDDCLAVYRWLVEHGSAGRPVAVAGDSAGGNLTLVTLMRARDALLPMPGCAVVLSPLTDLTLSSPSVKYNAEADAMFSAEAGNLLPPLYCPDQDRSNPLVSPLFGNWQGLPPLLFHAGSTEVLLDDSVRAQDRARQAGVDAGIEVFVDLPHVFHVFGWLPEAKVAQQGVADFVIAHVRSARRVLPEMASSPSAVAAGVNLGVRGGA